MPKKMKKLYDAEIEAYDEYSYSEVGKIFDDIHDRIIPDLDKLYGFAVQTYEHTDNQRIFVDLQRMRYALDDARNCMVKLADILSFDVLEFDKAQEEKKQLEAERRKQAEEDLDVPF